MNNEIEIKVIDIFESQTKQGIFNVILEEIETPKRHLPIIVGEKEAVAISTGLHKTPMKRPLTQDLMISCFDFAKIELSKVVIYKMDIGVYFSYIYLKLDDQSIKIDARSSDSIALALRKSAPIYILEDILSQEAIQEILQTNKSSKDKFVDDITGTPEFLERERSTNLKNLKRRLKQAILEENYELASLLRDQIKELNK